MSVATLSSPRSLPPVCATRLWYLHETYTTSPAWLQMSLLRTCSTRLPGTGALKPASSGLHLVLCVRSGHSLDFRNQKAGLMLRWTFSSRHMSVLASSERRVWNLSGQPEPGIWTARKAARQKLLWSKWKRLVSEVRKASQEKIRRRSVQADTGEIIGVALSNLILCIIGCRPP